MSSWDSIYGFSSIGMDSSNAFMHVIPLRHMFPLTLRMYPVHFWGYPIYIKYYCIYLEEYRTLLLEDRYVLFLYLCWLFIYNGDNSHYNVCIFALYSYIKCHLLIGMTHVFVAGVSGWRGARMVTAEQCICRRVLWGVGGAFCNLGREIWSG